MVIEWSDSLSIERWYSILTENEHVTFFHTPSWSEVMQKTYGYHPSTKLFCIDGVEILVPMMCIQRYGLNLFYSMPAGYGGFISQEDIRLQNIEQILDSLLRGRNIFFIATNTPTQNPTFRATQTADLMTAGNYTHLLSLENGFEWIYRNKFGEDVVRNIHRAENSHIEIFETAEINDYQRFYSLYTTCSKGWGYQTPPLPWELFKSLYEKKSNGIRLRVAVKDDQIIAGQITLEFGTYMSEYIGVTHPEFKKNFPFHLLTKEIIQDACYRGFQTLDFGSSSTWTGPKYFKERFGAESVPVMRHRALSRLGACIFHLKRIGLEK